MIFMKKNVLCSVACICMLAASLTFILPGKALAIPSHGHMTLTECVDLENGMITDISHDCEIGNSRCSERGCEAGSFERHEME